MHDWLDIQAEAGRIACFAKFRQAPKIIEGQGHQMGDAGWEQSVMGPLRLFLDGLT